MHTDGQPQPIEKVCEWVHHLKFPDWEEGCGTKDHAQRGVHEEGPKTYEEQCSEILRFFVHDVASRISELKEANVINLQLHKLAEEQVSGLVDDDTGEAERCNDGTGNEKHALPSYFPAA